MVAARDIVGVVFGRLTVLERAGRKPNRCVLWRCVCSCQRAKVVIVATDCLYSGKTRSCGCLRTEGAARARAAKRK
jgi:sigma54-dependent transcription regulator